MSSYDRRNKRRLVVPHESVSASTFERHARPARGIAPDAHTVIDELGRELGRRLVLNEKVQPARIRRRRQPRAKRDEGESRAREGRRGPHACRRNHEIGAHESR